MKNDVAIIGGGLAGLSLSIDLSMRGYAVTVIEKGNYPRHKVCGEYISMESYDYLHSICPGLSAYDLPRITNFKLSSTGKREFETQIDLGGFGISRYVLEELLYKEAREKGVVFMLACKAMDIEHNPKENFYNVKTTKGSVSANLVCNSTGRKSNIDSKGRTANPKNTNYIGIKYHVAIERDPSFIEIHNFPGGYCGISAIEEDKSCLCYIVNSKMLNNVGNSIQDLETIYLFQNRNLKRIFNTAQFLFKEPLTISGIHFRIKEPVNDSLFYLGDSAGSIAPVTGNGMSIAMRSACTLATLLDGYFKEEIDRQQLTESYSRFWNREFSTRIKLSRYFQKLSEFPMLTNMSIGIFNPFPSLANHLIRQTHGKPF